MPSLAIKNKLTMVVALSAAIVGFATALAGEDAETSSVEHTVDIRNFLYDPDPIQVKVGDTVTWTNHDIVPHTATLTATDSGTGQLLLSEHGSLKMQESGTLAYHCRYHANMKGVIQVE